MVAEVEQQPQLEARVRQGDVDALTVGQPQRLVEMREVIHIQDAPGVGIVVARAPALTRRVPDHGYRILRTDLDPDIHGTIVDHSQKASEISRFGVPRPAHHQDRR
ncbi:hypothetical protein GCM10027073_08880 [Streptomyces chlorus]